MKEVIIISISDVEKVDAMGISKDGQQLILLITDHLNWKNEYDHLMQLQNKINSYLGYIESQQYSEVYPNREFSSFKIDIRFKYNITTQCLKFIEAVNTQVSRFNIMIDITPENDNISYN